MAKKKVKHQSFKLSKHPYSREQVIFFVISAALIGCAIGWICKDQAAAVLGVSLY